MVQFHPVSKSEILELKEKERTDNSRLFLLLRLDIRKPDSRPHGSRKLIMTGRYNFYKVDFHFVIFQQKHQTNVLQINTLFYYFHHNKL